MARNFFLKSQLTNEGGHVAEAHEKYLAYNLKNLYPPEAETRPLLDDKYSIFLREDEQKNFRPG